MEQHPIPQNIASYQFRLVGNMTLKQFLELAAGGILALIIYKSGLPGIIKWPFVVIFSLAGVAFAFFPLEERPLDIWIVNFIKSIYSPTLYLWRKQPKLPDFFSFAPAKEKASAVKRLTLEERSRFSEYLKSLPQEPPLSLFEQKETKEMGKINEYLKQQTGLSPQKILISPAAANAGPAVLPSVKIHQLQEPMVKMADFFAPGIEIGTPFKLPKPKPKPPKPPRKEKPKKIHKTQLPLISKPEFANTIVGMVLTPDEKILPGAIVEIRDASGMPVRASKTNKLGQFFIATPLPNGEYEMEIDCPQFTFDIIKFKAAGKVLPPVKIKAKTSNPVTQ